jgi:hypothetical protein
MCGQLLSANGCMLISKEGLRPDEPFWSERNVGSNFVGIPPDLCHHRRLPREISRLLTLPSQHPSHASNLAR